MEPTLVSVEEAKQMMASHGQDMIFVMAWNKQTGDTNIVTAGSSPEHSRDAAQLANMIAKGLELELELGLCREPSESSLSSAQL